jgi:hypothetical protein
VTLQPPTPYTAATGNFLTAGLWNAQVRDGVGYLMSPPSFRAHAETAQNLLDGQWVSLNLETEEFDNYGGHSTTTNTSRYTCQVAGLYLVSGIASYTTNGAGWRAVRIQVNGSSTVHGSFVKTLPVSGGSSAVGTTCMVQLNVGDYIEVQGNQNSGVTSPGLATSASAGDVACSMSALWVSQ